jgi:hypothetical protein
MIPRDGIDRHRHGTDGTAQCGDGASLGCGGIKKISRCENKLGLLVPRFLPNPMQDIDALLLNQNTLVILLDPSEGLPELPIGSV